MRIAQISALRIRDAVRRAHVVDRRADQATSDVDLLVSSDTLAYADLFEALQAAETRLRRKVNPNVMTRAEWRSKRAQEDSFAARIAAERKLFVIGSDDDLA